MEGDAVFLQDNTVGKSATSQYHFVHASGPKRGANGICNGLGSLYVGGAHVILTFVVTAYHE